jgi:hypothetical protein
MDLSTSPRPANIVIDIDAVADLIVNTQKENGEIPWFPGDKTDPWDHVEAAMGLSVGGYLEEARQAFRWMKASQLPDGSWYAAYRDGIPTDKTRDTNFSSYLAVGVYHYYLVTGDKAFLEEMWETVKGGIAFALGLQAPRGEIYWALNPEGKVDPMALLTGSSSIYMSIKCALAMGKILGCRMSAWKKSFLKLEQAIRHKPYLFNMTKSRFSMDWFYPVLTGALAEAEARSRIAKYWRKFVVKGQGVRCVSDEPWITLAETSELALALAAAGNKDAAKIVFSWIQDKTFDDGSYWCGYTYPDMITWPEEKIAWTNAVILMAADALFHLTPASRLFSHQYWASLDFLP